MNFQKSVWTFYTNNRRDMPWRQTSDPYAIFLSEVMLQQTQVDRVREKYEIFLKHFPTVQSLAHAEFKEVLKHWSGLGYNRRALWLHQAAQEIVQKYGGKVPDSVESLTQLKGIGPNTAAAICVYAFNKPIPFIETNIRAVFIHHFFEDDENVTDAQLLPLVSETLDTQHAREWFWALMDYGVYIKKTYKNPAKRSKHHTKQSKFEGSKRQIRGEILRKLLSGPVRWGDYDSDILTQLELDGLVVRDGDLVQIR